MDTVEIEIVDPLVIPSLLGQIHLRIEGSLKKFSRPAKRYGCEFQTSGKIDGREIFVAWKRDIRLILQFHCTRFRTYSELLEWLSPLFNGNLKAFFEAKVIRLDICLDLQVPFDTVRSCFSFPRLTRILEITRKNRSLTLGRGARSIAIYEKSLDHRLLDFKAVNEPHDKVLAVRIEMRLKRSHIPIGTLEDAFRLTEIDFWHEAELRSLLQVDLESLPPRSQQLLESYKFRLQTKSHLEVKREFNKGRNFERSIGRLLRPVPDIDLSELGKAKMEAFFETRPK